MLHFKAQSILALINESVVASIYCGTCGLVQLQHIVLYVVHYIMWTMWVRIRRVPLSKALYHTCFIRKQGSNWWCYRPKLTWSVILDIKPVVYIFLHFTESVKEPVTFSMQVNKQPV